MIAAHVRMHDFASPSFARLCAMASRRDTARRREVHLLHDNGRVLSVVDTVSGRLDPPFAEVADAAGAARQLRELRQADRAIVADAAALRAMLDEVEARVTPQTSQPALMLLHQQAFRECPGVVCDPPMGELTSWTELAQLLRNVGDGAFVIAAGSSDEWSIALCGSLRDGLIVEVTDLPPAAVDALPDLARVARVLAQDVVLALVTELATLEEILASTDVARGLLDRLTTPAETT